MYAGECIFLVCLCIYPYILKNKGSAAAQGPSRTFFCLHSSIKNLSTCLYLSVSQRFFLTKRFFRLYKGRKKRIFLLFHVDVCRLDSPWECMCIDYRLLVMFIRPCNEHHLSVTFPYTLKLKTANLFLWFDACCLSTLSCWRLQTCTDLHLVSHITRIKKIQENASIYTHISSFRWVRRGNLLETLAQIIFFILLSAIKCLAMFDYVL